MKKRIYKLTLESLIRKDYATTELKYTLLKSIVLTQNISYINRLFCMYKINKKKYNSTKGRQQQRCIITGRTKSNIRDLSFSRHTTKQQGLLNRLQNIKVGSW